MMYVLQCTSGREAEARRDVAGLGYQALLPMAVRLERSGGKWRERWRVIMPGYLFIDQAIDDTIYHAIRTVPGVIQWLTPGRPVAISAKEAVFIRLLANNNQPLQPLLIGAYPLSGLRILAGPLMGYDQQLISVNRHRRRAVIRVHLFGELHDIELSAHFNS